jgi:hypothetical protein
MESNAGFFDNAKRILTHLFIQANAMFFKSKGAKPETYLAFCFAPLCITLSLSVLDFC